MKIRHEEAAKGEGKAFSGAAKAVISLLLARPVAQNPSNWHYKRRGKEKCLGDVVPAGVVVAVSHKIPVEKEMGEKRHERRRSRQGDVIYCTFLSFP